MIRKRWAILTLLTALNLVNYIDRYLVMAVGPELQKELHLSDSKLGAVETAFMIGYMITSPLFGMLGDRYARKGLIAAGVAVWSIATVVSGMTHEFWTMILARIAVGVGEASYATLSPTIIDDLGDEKSKNTNLTIFYAAIPVGAALGYVLGGALAPYGWRNAFFICGGPGLVLAIVTLAIAEPKRSFVAKSASTKGAYAALFRNPIYRDTVLGYVAQTFALGGFSAWAVPFLSRKLCFGLVAGKTIFGYILVGTGLLGTAIGGVISNRIKGDRTQAALKVCWWSAAIAAPLALLALMVPTPTMFIIALAATELAIFTSVSPVNAAVLSSVPPSLRATAMAASIFAIHLLGDLISPPILGGISDAYEDSKEACSGARGLQTAMYLLPIALALCAVFWWIGARRKPIESVAQVEA